MVKVASIVSSLLLRFLKQFCVKSFGLNLCAHSLPGRKIIFRSRNLAGEGGKGAILEKLLLVCLFEQLTHYRSPNIH